MISIRVNKQESDLIKKYAKLNGQTVSEVMRQAILEKIEDDFDRTLYKKGVHAHKNDGRTHSLAEAKALLDIE